MIWIQHFSLQDLYWVEISDQTHTSARCYYILTALMRTLHFSQTSLNYLKGSMFQAGSWVTLLQQQNMTGGLWPFCNSHIPLFLVRCTCPHMCTSKMNGHCNQGLQRRVWGGLEGQCILGDCRVHCPLSFLVKKFTTAASRVVAIIYNGQKKKTPKENGCCLCHSSWEAQWDSGFHGSALGKRPQKTKQNRSMSTQIF